MHAAGRAGRLGLPAVAFLTSASVDAVVLLGCRIEASGQRRAHAAAAHFLDSDARFLITSGGRRWAGHAEATALARIVEALGVEPEAVVTELCSLSTFENARYVVAGFERLGVRHAAIVTCDWHLPRALRCFRHFGASVVGVGAPSPPKDPLRRGLRSVREHLSFALDRTATLGLQAQR